MAGSGVFMWFWGATAAPEVWHGGYPTADRAAELAAGNRPMGDYMVVLADRAAIQTDIFSAGDILAKLETRNLDCWPIELPAVTLAELADLEAKLSDCLDRWLRKHHFDDTTALHSITAQDYFPAREASK